MRGRVGWEWKGDGDGDDVVVGKGEGSSSYALKRQSAAAGGVSRRAGGGGVSHDTGGAGVSWSARGVADDDLSCDGVVADDDDEMAMADVFLLEDERPGGVEEGEEEAPDAVFALATFLPRDTAMRFSSGGGRGRIVQVRQPPGGRRGGGREGRRMQWEHGWHRSRVEPRVVIVQGGGEGRRGGRGRGWIDVIGRIGVG